MLEPELLIIRLSYLGKMRENNMGKARRSSQSLGGREQGGVPVSLSLLNLGGGA